MQSVIQLIFQKKNLKCFKSFSYLNLSSQFLQEYNQMFKKYMDPNQTIITLETLQSLTGLGKTWIWMKNLSVKTNKSHLSSIQDSQTHFTPDTSSCSSSHCRKIWRNNFKFRDPKWNWLDRKPNIKKSPLDF